MISTGEKRKLRKAIVLIALAFMAVVLAMPGAGADTAWSLLPPAVAIFLAFVSGRLSLSLSAAVLLGGFIYTQSAETGIFSQVLRSIQRTIFHFISSLVGSESAQQVMSPSHFSWTTFTESFDPINLQILIFVFCILSTVHVITASGGLHAVVRALQGKIRGPRSAQFVTFFLGLIIFIDDYANTMIVGSTMQKITDRYHISREKLAFLVDATSAPVAGLALVSTWIGYEVGLFSEMAEKFAWGVDGYSVFLQAIPFRFYCFMMLGFVFLNILTGVEYGPMAESATTPINAKNRQVDEKRGPMLCATLPLGVLLFMVFSLLWFDGGGLTPGRSIFSLADWRDVLTASQNGIAILMVSSATSFALSLFLALFLSQESSGSIFVSLWSGVKSSALPIMILVLAWSLKAVCDDLNTGEYIASALSGSVSPALLPFCIFIVSALTAFATGTSWGTMAILIPTVTPLALAMVDGQYGLYVALSLAAILDGAIMGDHCSPISDTTIMSSISTGCDLLSHVRTQLPYSLTVCGFAIVFGYLPAGLRWSRPLSLGLGLVLLIALFFVLKRATRKKFQ